MRSEPSTAAEPRAVLYVCTTQNGNRQRVLIDLHAYAAARGWTVVGEYTDDTGVQHESDRPGFLAVKELIAARRATVLLTWYPSMAAALPEERDVLCAWLSRHGAQLHTAWVPDRTVPARVVCHCCAKDCEEAAATLVGDRGGTRLYACAVCMVSRRPVPRDQHPAGSDGRPLYRDCVPGVAR